MDYSKIIGKTIKSIKDKKLSEYDDSFIEIIFTDETSVVLEPMYGAFTGDSSGEFPKYILFHDCFDKKLLEE